MVGLGQSVSALTLAKSIFTTQNGVPQESHCSSVESTILHRTDAEVDEWVPYVHEAHNHCN